MYHKRIPRCSFRDQCPSFVRIIVDECQICQWKIKVMHVGEAGPIPPNYHALRNVMSSLSDSSCYPVECSLD